MTTRDQYGRQVRKSSNPNWRIPVFRDKDQPPAIYEYFVQCYWFESSGIHGVEANIPLKGRQKADIVIAGGGFAGLAAAYQLIQRFPEKRIVVLEGAVCGYGASGRNGGAVMPLIHGLDELLIKEGPENARRLYDAILLGIKQIEELAEKHGLSFDYEDTGNISLATEENHIVGLQGLKNLHDEIGVESKLIERDELQKSIKSTRYVGGWFLPVGGHMDPAKLARGMKHLVEDMGVEVFEHSRILRINPGKKVVIETEFGEVEAPDIVVTLNGYAPKIGFFEGRVIPLTNHVIATEPLTTRQMESIGWRGRENLADIRSIFDYFRLTADNRIVFGGQEMLYFYNNTPSTGNYKPLVDKLIGSLYTTFPQLEGVAVTNAWSGTMGFTLDFFPSIGVLGDEKNIYYATGFSGGGNVLAQLSGIVLTHLYAGEESDLTRLAFVNRKMPWAGFEPFRFPISRIMLRRMSK